MAADADNERKEPDRSCPFPRGSRASHEPRDHVAREKFAHQRRVVSQEEPGGIGIDRERRHSDQVRPGDVIEPVHRSRVERETAPFEVSKESAVLPQ